VPDEGLGNEGFGIEKIDLRRELSALQGKQTKDRLDGTGRAEGVAESGFGRTEFGLAGAEDAVESLCFGPVVEGRPGAMGVDVTDVRRVEALCSSARRMARSSGAPSGAGWVRWWVSVVWP
jgi:hypothetical protein